MLILIRVELYTKRVLLNLIRIVIFKELNVNFGHVMGTLTSEMRRVTIHKNA